MKHVYTANAPFRLGKPITSCSASIKEYRFKSVEDFKSFLRYIYHEYMNKGYEVCHKDKEFEVHFGDIVLYVHRMDIGKFTVTFIEFE